MRPLALMTILSLLAACGVDGEPVPPKDQPKTGITISGTARVGITKEL